MKKTLIIIVMLLLLVIGCATGKKTCRLNVDTIISFNLVTACDQAYEVIRTNPYSQTLLEKVVDRLVRQAKKNPNAANGDVIYDEFFKKVKDGPDPLIPPVLGSILWNEYFSSDFLSLPKEESGYCKRLNQIQSAIDREIERKTIGFEALGKSLDKNQENIAKGTFDIMIMECGG